jgi:hypothetical protein
LCARIAARTLVAHEKERAMKRSIEALVAVAAVLGLAAAAPSAQAVSPVVGIDADASLATRTGAARLHVGVSFSTDTPGADPFTIQKAVIHFPDRQGTNGRFFPSCGAAQIERFHGDVSRCPKGSRLGGGTLSARALQLGITAHGRVALFNGPGGRSVTFNIQAQNPALINESIDAPLTRPDGGKEQLELVVPHSLQEIISGVFVGIQAFDVTLSAATRVRGVDYSYIAARTCPKRGMRGVFDFQDWTTGQTATATADAELDCRDGRSR